MNIDIVRCVVLAALLMIAVFGAVTAADSTADKAPVVSIKGQVVYGREPVAKVTISIEGAPNHVTTSDAKGEFVFNDLAPGEYKLTAQGTAKNNIRKGSATVKVVESAKDPEPITIKLN
jgi:hypothetical protein